MTPCRLYLTACALSLALGALVCLAVANHLLMALDDAHGAAREGLEERRRGVTRVTRPSDMETAWLIRDSAEKGYVFERGAAEWSVN